MEKHPEPIRDPRQVDRYYQALVDRDPSYLGSFFVGVKTTGIVCISTCRARKPRRENVEFFTALKDALDHGYRPCKICRPAENASDAPEFVRRAMDMMRSADEGRVSDAMLRETGIQPERVRRWFKGQYGMTFHAYQRMHRINSAMQQLQGGSHPAAVALDAGYESLSGFSYTYRRVTGSSPTDRTTYRSLIIERVNTPLGPMLACASPEGLCLLEFVDRRGIEREFGDLQRRTRAPILAGRSPFIDQTRRELAEYFDGTRTRFTVDIDAPGTPFQQEVWKTLREIPFGATRSYGDQAERLGRPRAVRAVARANGSNRIAIIVPCHRVIGADGHLVGYAGGLERKRWLLEHERIVAAAQVTSQA